MDAVFLAYFVCVKPRALSVYVRFPEEVELTDAVSVLCAGVAVSTGRVTVSVTVVLWVLVGLFCSDTVNVAVTVCVAERSTLSDQEGEVVAVLATELVTECEMLPFCCEAVLLVSLDCETLCEADSVEVRGDDREAVELHRRERVVILSVRDSTGDGDTVSERLTDSSAELLTVLVCVLLNDASSLLDSVSDSASVCVVDSDGENSLESVLEVEGSARVIVRGFVSCVG